jgi:hypothetical protein
MAMVIGNHDMWIEGGPADADEYDQHGNGMMQYYAMDPAASIALNHGNFLDFSVNPDEIAQWNTSLNTAANLIWWNQIGDTAFIGVSGAFTEQELGPHLDAACQWLATMEDEQDATKPNWLFLLGHWDKDTSQTGEQCDPCAGMATPSIYHRLRNTPGCLEFGNRFKYQDGHTHCNYIQEKDPTNNEALGFMIGGAGMKGCSQYGFEYIESDGASNLKIWYFELENNNTASRSDVVFACIEEYGLSNCTEHAVLWFEGGQGGHGGKI